MASIALGCIADDVTGATDLANTLVRAGMRVVQTIGVPSAPLDAATDVDAVVVAQKTRTVPVADAVAQSLAALTWLREQGARQVYFKYCSTFDSTPAGNIGPVTEALMDALATDFTIACPAFPENGRTIYKGYLFVGDVLLDESGMRNHPLTPMTDPSLVRVLQEQTKRRVGLVEYRDVARGAEAIGRRFDQLRGDGVGIAIVDALTDADLMAIGKAAATLPLVTAGSGVAMGLPRNFALGGGLGAAALPPASGAKAIVSGSCSVATNGQVAAFIAAGGEALRIDPSDLARGDWSVEGVRRAAMAGDVRSAGVTDAGRGVDAAVAAGVVEAALAWAGSRLGERPILVYTTAAPDAVRAAQAALGAERTGEMIERTLAAIARGLVERGVRQLIVAGGETSGACTAALGIEQLRIGTQIAPGVPWCHAHCAAAGAGGLHIALKSGNFGAPDFFTQAFDLLR